VNSATRRADRAIRDQMDCPNLSPERERQLLRAAQDPSDPAARQSAVAELWSSHSKLVIAIARRYAHLGIDMLDLVGAGHLGLHTAIDRFAPDHFGTRLSSYAIGWIRWHIQDHVRRNAAAVRLPNSGGHRQLAQLGPRLMVEARRSCMRDGVEPRESELCLRIGRRVGLEPDEVARSLRLLEDGTLSLDHAPAADGAAPTLRDTLADDTACSEDDVIRRLDYAKLRKRIMILVEEILGERERIVFLARCMTDQEDIAHLDGLATRFGVSRERVYQLEASAKRKIAAALAQEGFGDVGKGVADLRLPGTRAPRRPTTGAVRIPALARSAG
jgi:RNA polymerase sigma factor (sigma-70 family)